MDGGVHDLRARELTMARELKWIAAAGLCCLALGLVYLPPKTSPLFGRRFRELPPPTSYRLRVQELAAAWRDVEIERRLLEYRERLRPELARRRALEIPGPAVIVDWPDAGSEDLRRYVATALDSAWGRLGLGVTKISVGVVASFGATTPDQLRPSLPRTMTVYLLPDSSDRSTCLVFMQGYYWARGLQALPRSAPHDARFEAFLQNVLGPCAYYAAFGAPGREIWRWLGARRFDLALYPRWGRAPGDSANSDLVTARHQPWYWYEVYQYPPEAIGCLAGRPAACEAAVLAGAGGTEAPARIVSTERWWWRQALFGADYYLADAVRTLGHERFRRLWGSELPVDSALAEAFRKPVGEWTRDWQAGVAPPIRLGPATSLGSTLLGLLLAAAALALVARTVSRREVR
jgi:hypothetical protein